MAVTDLNNEDRLVQATFSNFLRDELGWDTEYAWNQEKLGPDGTLGRQTEQEVVLVRDLQAALVRLNPQLPPQAIAQAIDKLRKQDVSRTLLQHNREQYDYIRNGVPVSYRDSRGTIQSPRARVIDFDNPEANRFLAVRELTVVGLRAPNYRRRADLVCFVNGLPLVFFELKAIHRNVRTGFDKNLRDYKDSHNICHVFHHNAFLVVSNGVVARYGSITSEWEHFAEWKRDDESDKGSVDAEVLLRGMMNKARLLDVVENFILFDTSKPEMRKVVARNQQVLGVNRAVEAVRRQESIKAELRKQGQPLFRLVDVPTEQLQDGDTGEPSLALKAQGRAAKKPMAFIEPSHPDLGKIGVFWHTQGSGKSYSMAFFTEKVRRKISKRFTFVVMTDRHDLDGQIYQTFVGCGIVDAKVTPRATSGPTLQAALGENHPYIFSLIHKFNRDVDPRKPYSQRDDIIVLSDEAHRTQAGKLARNMRQALPCAAFIGFTGTPIFKQDNLTKRIFGGYISRYDFKRSVEDGATVRLVYENRGEKLGICRQDLNDRIAGVIEVAELDPDQEAKLESLLGSDYEVLTAPDRLDKLADDFVAHYSTRWQSGKAMFVCVDKLTCARMYQRILPRWEQRRADLVKQAEAEPDPERKAKLETQARWMQETLIEVIVSEGQNEVQDFKKWDYDIVRTRMLMKQGFETADGKRIDVERAFKSPKHPFRVAIVCAMWLTGFDVESLATLYLDKPMKAHTLMQAIARANRCYPDKEFGLIVDYNGMLKSLRAALAQYALGEDASAAEEIVAPLAERTAALLEALIQAEAVLRAHGFDPDTMPEKRGFPRIRALADAVEALNQDAESRRRFEILARIVFARFRSLSTERSAYVYAERHDNIEAIFRKLSERRDGADVTQVLKALHELVGEAIRAQQPSDESDAPRQFDLSTVDVERLQQEFARKVTHKATTIRAVQEIVERKLSQMLRLNPERMDYYKRYSEIVADYNREKDRVTLEDTFARLMEFVQALDEEQLRHVREGLSEDELAVFDLLQRDNLTQAQRERVKDASRSLLAELERSVAELDRWTQKEQTQAEIRSLIFDRIHQSLPTPPYSESDKEAAAHSTFLLIFQKSQNGDFPKRRAA